MTEKSFEEKLNSPLVQRKISDYLDSKQYVKDALKQRKLYHQDPNSYNPEKAPENVRDLCRISKDTYESGVRSEFAGNVEHIPQDIAYNICKLLDAPKDQPMVPYVESLIRKYDLDPVSPSKDSPKP